MVVQVKNYGDHHVTLELQGNPDDIRKIVTGLVAVNCGERMFNLLTGSFCYGTFYAETEAEVIGVTDDENGCVMTRDDEPAAAAIFLFHRK